MRASLASLAKRLDAGDLADQLGGGQRAAAGLSSSSAARVRDQGRELAFELADRAGQLADPADQLAGDPHPRCLLGAGEPAAEAVQPDAPVQAAAAGSRARARGRAGASAAGSGSVSARRRGPRGGRAAAGPRAPARPAARPAALGPSRSAARAIARASIASDLPRSRPARRASPISFGGDPHHPLATREQEALQRARDVPAVLERPHPLGVQLARPDEHMLDARRARRDRPLAGTARSPHRQRQRCGSACGCPLRSRSSARSPSLGLPRQTDRRRTDLSWGDCHAPIRSRRRSSDGGGRQNGCRSASRGDTEPKGQPAANSEPNRTAGHKPVREDQDDTEASLTPAAVGATCRPLVGGFAA